MRGGRQVAVGGAGDTVGHLAPHRADPQQRGFLQALDSAGTPLCLSCQAPCRPGDTWDGRFCQQRCREDFQTRSSGAYVRTRVFEAEHGVCQHCGLNARELFTRVRDAPHTHRKEILEGTWLAQLPLKLVSSAHHGVAMAGDVSVLV